MIKILIVEDDLNKCNQLKDSLQKKLDNLIIEERKSYQSGLKEIVNNDYDLILLDMSMPTYDDGERYRAFAGRDILQQMSRRKINVKTIIITQFETFGDDNKVSIEELRKSLEKAYNEIYCGIIYYKAGLSDWKDELISLVKKLAENN
ncbi:MAG: Response regulator [Clostridium butyricum DORA_1]|uniref:response regulator n=1 Tax=Clostridium neonatale TaxID=137838 RepID=UPI0003D60329|nr:MAG: Response regulator [Clostridium butyricum DORA_1]MDU1510190.1 response regulator [Clostridium butyricum]